MDYDETTIFENYGYYAPGIILAALIKETMRIMANLTKKGGVSHTNIALEMTKEYWLYFYFYGVALSAIATLIIIII